MTPRRALRTLCCWHRVPGHLAFHIWIPGVVSVVFGDRTTGYRFAISIHRRKVFGWRYVA